MLVYWRVSSTKTVPSSSFKKKWLEKMFWVMRLWWGYVTSCRSSDGRIPAPSGDNPPKTTMTMDKPPFEDVFSIENGDFPMSC